MGKKDCLELLMLLSAVESWSFADKHHLPDFLYDKLDICMAKLKSEILEEK